MNGYPRSTTDRHSQRAKTARKQTLRECAPIHKLTEISSPGESSIQLILGPNQTQRRAAAFTSPSLLLFFNDADAAVALKNGVLDLVQSADAFRSGCGHHVVILHFHLLHRFQLPLTVLKQ